MSSRKLKWSTVDARSLAGAAPMTESLCRSLRISGFPCLLGRCRTTCLPEHATTDRIARYQAEAPNLEAMYPPRW